MSGEAVALVRDSAALEAMSLPELAVTISESAKSIEAATAQVSRATTDTLRYALVAGEALNVAHRKVARNAWRKWLAENVAMTYVTAWRYERLAFYRHEVEGLIEAGEVTGLVGALRLIKDLPPIPGCHASEQMLETARRMRSDGASITEIAETMGRPYHTVWGWLNPKTIERGQRNRAAKRAKVRQALQEMRERDEKAQVISAAKTAGDPVSSVYSLVRRALSQIDKAKAGNTGSQRDDLEAAMAALHKAEDHLVAAMRLRHD